MIDAVCGTARRGHMRLAQQALHEMERRHMKPSLTAHNAVLDVLAGEGRWAECLQVLARDTGLDLASYRCEGNPTWEGNSLLVFACTGARNLLDEEWLHCSGAGLSIVLGGKGLLSCCNSYCKAYSNLAESGTC